MLIFSCINILLSHNLIAFPHVTHDDLQVCPLLVTKDFFIFTNCFYSAVYWRKGYHLGLHANERVEWNCFTDSHEAITVECTVCANGYLGELCLLKEDGRSSPINMVNKHSTIIWITCWSTYVAVCKGKIDNCFLNVIMSSAAHG